MSPEANFTGTGEERSNSLLSNARCTFCFPCCFGSRRSASVGIAWWERVRTRSWSESQTQAVTGSVGVRWWARGFMKVREWSEIVAGPRWKTFIRRFNRSRSGGGNGGRYGQVGKYQYDPLSYALNFDEGPGQNGDSDDHSYEGFRNFSCRYAAAPVSSAAPPFKSVTTDVSEDDVVFG
ncbi:hypothetical protein HN51_009146 [Arachis hypogaea]|uniref:Uncharacterized protein n=2 Tax=Arachis TaxID=3817 RepID=A0A445D0M7_ARAHY|nr:uncharacterized protein LOC107491380 [Arachis duranensis]XP_025701612.1 uncharacterized protein LOC112802562 [Arachis hypogaea]RYR56708.1 hypothetical protein Ahy_A05g022396 isoform B [Arachis hypogaea]